MVPSAGQSGANGRPNLQLRFASRSEIGTVPEVGHRLPIAADPEWLRVVGTAGEAGEGRSGAGEDAAWVAVDSGCGLGTRFAGLGCSAGPAG